MNKISFVIIMLLLVSFVSASDIEENIYQGTSLEENNYQNNVNPIDEESLNLQTISAQNNENQIGIKAVTGEEKKNILLDKISDMWAMFGSVFVLLFDILKSMMYLIEVYIIFVLLFKLFPEILIKIKNSVTTWYMEKLK